MTNINLFVFTQPNCNPCYRLKDYIKQLPSEQQAAVEFCSFKTPDGRRTALAEELDVTLTPTLVVPNEEMVCELPDEDDFESCDFEATSIETIVGATNIITALPGVINNYVLSEDI